MFQYKFIFFICFMLSFVFALNGQTITPSIVNSSGNSAVISGNTYEYSIGELTVVSTQTAGSNDYTQGLLQPSRLKVDAIDNLSIKYSINVYPNPAHDFLTIDATKAKFRIEEIQLLDALGKTLFVSSVINSQIFNLDMKSYAQGNYSLVVKLKNQNSIVYKISK